MLNFKLSLFFVFCFTSTTVSEKRMCGIRRYTSKSALIYKYINSTQIPLLLDFTDVYNLNDGGSLEIHCPIGLSIGDTSFDDCNENGRVVLDCKNGGWFCNGKFSHHQHFDWLDVGCKTFGPLFYESRLALKNCAQYNSFVIGIKSTYGKRVVNAAACYDMDTLTLKYVTYNGNYEIYNFTSDVETKGFDDINFGNLYNDFENNFNLIMKTRYKELMLKVKTVKSTLRENYHFDYKTILPKPQLDFDLSEYANVFQIVWWRDFHLGNWRSLMEVYDKFAKTIEHKVYIGTTGLLSMPTEHGNEVQHFVIERDDFNITTTAPELTWFYIDPLNVSNNKDKLVFVGYNTPFYQYNESPFCKDICHKIDWLNNSTFLKTHLMPTLGLMHCCHVADVVGKLDNFPYD